MKRLLILSLTLLFGCQNTPERVVEVALLPPDSPLEVEQTWQDAYVYVAVEQEIIQGLLRDGEVAHHLKTRGSARPYAAVIYLHGCDGLFPNIHREFWQRLAAKNVAVFMPDSFARTQRRVECGRQRPWTYQARLAEIDFALAQIATFNSIDKDRIVLFGHSEGGVAVSRYQGDDIRGAVITSANCRKFALRVPSLALRARNDPGVTGMGCTRADRHVVLPGSDHNILNHRKATDQIIAFINEVTG